MLEKEVESKIVAYATKERVLTYKFSSPQRRGVPDRIFLYNGKALFLEIKRLGKKPTKLQYKHLQLISDAGHRTGWVDNVEDGKLHIDMLKAVSLL